MDARFPDRRAAGQALAPRLSHLRGPGTLVLGLPRGGVPVAAEVATALNAPLDILLVRKIGMPENPELALGAIAGPAGETLILNEALVLRSGLGPAGIEARAAPERAELARRRALWGGGVEMGAVRGKTVILVDDGVATGATMRAAIAAVRSGEPARVVVATPVAPPDVVVALTGLADEVVCLFSPADFIAVGRHYALFPQLQDDEVRRILGAARRPASSGRSQAG
ncbi:phosphoribosyltransferase [Rhodobacter sp. SY28-1]|uniref:phosphoribosyltransferase n=1 Tax=Rhodobacter sp. SY28-1 TaxID=2562317 RepID=UPI0010BFF0D2|nr:phosphoribosyltransferase family protein [Rhodobacter sp. SY28-1]